MKIGCCISVKHIQSVKQCQFDFAELSTKEIMAIDDGVWEETKKSLKRQEFLLSDLTLSVEEFFLLLDRT